MAKNILKELFKKNINFRTNLFESALLSEDEDTFSFDEDEFEQEKDKDSEKNSTETPYVVPIQLKAAMLANNLDEYTATLWNLYKGYIDVTKDIKTGDNDAIINRPGANKLDTYKQQEFNRIVAKKNPQQIVSWMDENDSVLSSEDKDDMKKWFHQKDFNVIPYANGTITNRGKAILNFLGAFLSGKSTNADDNLLYNSKYRKAFEKNASDILSSFYNFVLINLVKKMVNRDTLTETELETIKEIVNRTIEKLMTGGVNNSYDPTRNLGAWFITVSLNSFRDYLRKFIKQVPDFGLIQNSLETRQTSDPDRLIKIKSKISPNDIRGNTKKGKGRKSQANFSKVKRLENGLYLYIYKDVAAALSDFNVQDGTVAQPSPLTHLLYRNLPIEERNYFYKGIVRPGTEQSVERYDKNTHELGKEADYQEYKGFNDDQSVAEVKRLLSLSLEYILNKSDFDVRLGKKDNSVQHKKATIAKAKEDYEIAKAKGSKSEGALKQKYDEEVAGLVNVEKRRQLIIDFIYGLLGNFKPTDARKEFDKGSDVTSQYNESLTTYINDFNNYTLRQYKAIAGNKDKHENTLRSELQNKNMWIPADDSTAKMVSSLMAKKTGAIAKFFSNEEISKKLNYKNEEIWSSLVELLAKIDPSFKSKRTFEEQKNNLMENKNYLLENLRKKIRNVLTTLFEEDIKTPNLTYDGANTPEKTKEYKRWLEMLFQDYKRPEATENEKDKIVSKIIGSFAYKGIESRIVKDIAHNAGIKDIWRLIVKEDEAPEIMYEVVADPSFIHYLFMRFNPEISNFLTYLITNAANRYKNEHNRRNTYVHKGERHDTIVTSLDNPIDSENSDSGTMGDFLPSNFNQELASEEKELSEVILNYILKNIATSNVQKTIIEKVAEGLKPQEIAEDTGLSDSNVRTTLSRIASKMTQDIRDNEFGSYIYNIIGFDISRIPRIKRIMDGKDSFTFYFIGLNEWYDNNDLMLDVITENILKRIISSK